MEWSQQQGSVKKRTRKNGNRKNTCTQNQKERAEIPWTHNEKGRLGKLNPHKTY